MFAGFGGVEDDAGDVLAAFIGLGVEAPGGGVALGVEVDAADAIDLVLGEAELGEHALAAAFVGGRDEPLVALGPEALVPAPEGGNGFADFAGGLGGGGSGGEEGAMGGEDGEAAVGLGDAPLVADGGLGGLWLPLGLAT